MKTPESLETLVDYGIIQEVIRPLMSGKEAQVFVVVSEGSECVAKVYKEAHNRTFKHRAEYTEGRKTRNTRDQRAINKRTRHGKKQDEAAWRNAEVDTLYRLRDGGVRVPEPLNFVDGVLVMELVRDAEGDPAPRLGDLEFEPPEAYEIYKKLIREVIRMLCAGTIHGDLSEFNVLMGAQGPVVIDFPQSIDPAKNQSARKLLLRDVENLHRFLARHAPAQVIKPLGEEMWALYEKNRLSAGTELLGDYVAPSGPTDVTEVLALIEDANQDERLRRGDRVEEEDAPSPLRRVVDFTKDAKAKSASPSKSKPRSRPRKRAGASPGVKADSTTHPESRPKKQRRNRGRGKPGPRSEVSSERRNSEPAANGRREPPTGPAATTESGSARKSEPKSQGDKRVAPKRRRRRRSRRPAPKAP